MYVFEAEIVPPTLKSSTRCELLRAPGGDQAVREGAQPLAKEKLQVLPPYPAGKGIESSELVSCWMPCCVVCETELVIWFAYLGSEERGGMEDKLGIHRRRL